MNHDDEPITPAKDEIVAAEIVADAAVPPLTAPPMTAPPLTAPPLTAPAADEPRADNVARVETEPPSTWSEIGAMLLLVMLADMTIYRGHGYAGYAFLFTAAPLMVLLGAVRRKITIQFVVIAVMLFVLVLKLLWCGSLLLVACGFGLLAASAMALTGQSPFVVELAIFVSQTIRSGWEAVLQYGRTCNRTSPAISSFPLINIALPAAAFLVFSLIFVLANPDLFASISDRLGVVITGMRRWMSQFSLWEVAFWMVTGWLSLGLLRPWAGALQSPFGAVRAVITEKPAPAPLYSAFRNTLLTVIGLFGVYLIFEFATLWFREFPQGFHYSGYAHEGAAWLTVALALATAVLSLVFRGSVLNDPRLNQLRRLAWIWSALNLLVAVAVYNRLFIYVGFNGLTQMRMIGLFGISLVVCGFILVMMKIARNHDAIWLIRRQLLAFAGAVFLFALTPVDTLVVRYNVARILRGDEAPSVQMTVQTIGSEGILALLPLLDAENAIIRDGIQVMLANRLDRAEEQAERNSLNGWTTYQLSDQRVLRGLRASRQQWRHFDDPESRDLAWRRFVDYAYQWF